MPAFGENLRREREMRGVSLEEISSATKISLRFLEAIEREDFAKLPGGIFSRSFIRSYARYLGLDEERVVAEFQLAARPQMDFDLHRMPSGKSSSGRPGTRTPLIATLVAVVLLVGGYVLFRYTPRAAEVPAPLPPAPVAVPTPTAPPIVPAPTTSGEATAAPGVNPPEGQVTPATAPGATAAPGTTPNPQAGPAAGASPVTPPNPQTGNPPGTNPAADTDLVLQVAATDRAWVAVDADGKTVLQRVLNPNEVETLKAHKSFDVTTGNAQAVILTLNGETLEPLGRRGEVKSRHLTHDDVKKPAP
jgi:cytoskeleton protein RodZ